MEPFKLLRNDCSIDQFRSRFADIGFDLDDSVVPDTAYEESVLSFLSDQLPSESIKVVVVKQLWPDGDKWEDATVSLLHNENEVAKIDLQLLLREKLDRPLLQYVMETLLDAASKERLAGT